MKTDALKDVHTHTLHNRREIECSQACCCISCRARFRPSEIFSYADGGTTAICPYCDCDAVLGDACGITLSDRLLDDLNKKYF